MAPDIMRELDASAASLAALTSAMFGALSAALVIALACYWRCPGNPGRK
ncbi:MAG: hypothetical protein IT530_07780 [Burkholderiales bacterium]|nr:hypothetical protein [Burkholderiales bacterium]